MPRENWVNYYRHRVRIVRRTRHASSTTESFPIDLMFLMFNLKFMKCNLVFFFKFCMF